MKIIRCFIFTLLTFTMLVFVPNSFAQDANPEYVVRVIYFLPNDREPDPDMDTKLDTIIKEVQDFYADQLEVHGFGRKTFKFEADDNGNAVVHHVNGKFNDAYYQHDSIQKTIEEINERFDTSKNICLIAQDGSQKGYCGRATGKFAFLHAPGDCVRPWVAAHELGHTFGLWHDRRDSSYIMYDFQTHYYAQSKYSGSAYSEGGQSIRIYNQLSQCAAQWLDVHRYFNDNQSVINNPTESQMFSPSLVSPPNTIRLRFELSDPDRLHLVQLITETTRGYPENLVSCKLVNGESTVVEFETTELTTDMTDVMLNVIDVTGNITTHRYIVDITSLRPPSEVVVIPDAELEAALRKTLKLTKDSTITKLDMLRLTLLENFNGGKKTDLTGLSHATNLKALYLQDNRISDISSLAGLTKLGVLWFLNCELTDISPLAGTTNMQELHLQGNQITDISPLAGLTRLQILWCGKNRINDISPLADLTQLASLSLSGNRINDISPLAGLTKLRELGLSSNQISDIAPLNQIRLLWGLDLGRNQISDISFLVEMKELKRLKLSNNKIGDITSLTDLTQLTELSLSDNQIRDITPLSGLKNLQLLRLSNNQISDVSPLVELTNLKELTLVGNPIKNKKPLFALLTKNPDVRIYLEDHRTPLPVTLSQFRAEHTDAGVVLNWTTESEVDNAGFYIYRSPTKDGEFKVINSKIIQGAGTTGERNEYTWTDTTAKPNTVYYYQIEDVSHAGVREQLATVRLRGLVSASGKLTTIWANLKWKD